MTEDNPTGLIMYKHEDAYIYRGTELEQVKNLKCREDDVWVCSFPRSGTTLTQQTVYLILTLDFEKASSIPLEDRFPMIEIDLPGNDVIFRGPRYVEAKPEDEPRMIKSHLHYKYLPTQLKQGKGKIIYIMRNPKASFLSLYNVAKYIKHPMASEPLEEFLKKALAGRDVYSLPWGPHLTEYWDHRNDPNVLLLQFEHSVMDRVGTIKKIADFLGKDLTDEQINKIVEHTSIKTMKGNDAVNFAYFEEAFSTDKSRGEFINSGEISGWKRNFPKEFIQPFDEMIERELGHTDIVFPE